MPVGISTDVSSCGDRIRRLSGRVQSRPGRWTGMMLRPADAEFPRPAGRRSRLSLWLPAVPQGSAHRACRSVEPDRCHDRLGVRGQLAGQFRCELLAALRIDRIGEGIPERTGGLRVRDCAISLGRREWGSPSGWIAATIPSRRITPIAAWASPMCPAPRDSQDQMALDRKEDQGRQGEQQCHGTLPTRAFDAAHPGRRRCHSDDVIVNIRQGSTTEPAGCGGG